MRYTYVLICCHLLAKCPPGKYIEFVLQDCLLLYDLALEPINPSINSFLNRNLHRFFERVVHFEEKKFRHLKLSQPCQCVGADLAA
jgi:hypothetical protein